MRADISTVKVWTPEFTQTIHNARCVLIDATMQPATQKSPLDERAKQ